MSMTIPSQPEQKYRDLTRAECWELTLNTYYARLGTYEDEEIYITPVNIQSADGKIYFRTAAGSKFSRLQAESRVTLQLDRVTDESAYSVNLYGNARVLKDPSEIQQISQLGMVSWIPTEKQYLVEIAPYRMSGRFFYLK